MTVTLLNTFLSYSFEWRKHCILYDKIMIILEYVYSTNAESRSLRRLFEAIRTGKI